jgi:hypothetical protein
LTARGQCPHVTYAFFDKFIFPAADVNSRTVSGSCCQTVFWSRRAHNAPDNNLSGFAENAIKTQSSSALRGQSTSYRKAFLGTVDDLLYMFHFSSHIFQASSKFYVNKILISMHSKVITLELYYNCWHRFESYEFIFSTMPNHFGEIELKDIKLSLRETNFFYFPH